jgi:hypothetical protein
VRCGFQDSQPAAFFQADPRHVRGSKLVARSLCVLALGSTGVCHVEGV